MAKSIDYSRLMDIKSAVQSFGALAQETRLEVVRLLVRAGVDGMSAGEIAQELEVRQNTMSSHLLILVNAGLLESQRDGRSIIYRVQFKGLRQVLKFLVEDCCQGKPEDCGLLLDTALGNICPQAVGV